MSTERAVAHIAGSSLYKTTLYFDHGELDVDCTCPHAEDGFFCKHGVALGLTWLAAPHLEASGDEPALIRRWLEEQPHAALVELLMGFADQDIHLWRNLRSASQVLQPHSASDLRRLIDDIAQPQGYLDWGSESKLAADVTHLVEILRNQLSTDNLQALPALCEHAIRCVVSLTEEIAESNDEIEFNLTQLQSLHHEACTLVKPDPMALAEQLLELALASDMYVFQDTFGTYADVLGEPGRQHFQLLLQQRWAQLPAITKKEKDHKDHNYAVRERLTAIMKKTARQAGDIEQLIAIVGKDLSTPNRYLELAELHLENGAAGVATQWAEEGLAQFSGLHATQLEAFVIERYVESDRCDEAQDMAWTLFCRSPSLRNYQRLHGIGCALGRWPERRLAALHWLTKRPGDRYASGSLPDPSIRLEIALWEQDLAGAWDAFCAGPCRISLALRLADLLEATTPGQAVAIYQRILASQVALTCNSGYEAGMQMVARLAHVMSAEAFAELRANLHRQYKAKRNFIKLLDAFASPK
ncbi:zinc finger SWIM domain-containing protein [Pseudomonas sp. M47T1]|nr:zinc finger SWIM domain-containing protein [Pseudomonas sp. M47T1]